MFYTSGTSESYRRLGYNFTMKVYCQAFQQFMDEGADGYCLWDVATLDPETNIFDLGRKPRSPYPDRLVRKYELIQWDGWLWNRYSPLESS